jgi:hypothetical protein
MRNFAGNFILKKMFLNLKKKKGEGEEKETCFLMTRWDFLARGIGRVPTSFHSVQSVTFRQLVNGSKAKQKGEQAH